MNLHASAIVVVSAMLHALWNALIKREQRTELATVAVLAIAFLTALVAFCFRHLNAFPERGGWVWGIASGVCEALYFGTLGRALSRAPLGSAYAVARGGAAVFVWPMSILWFNEPVTPEALGGAALVTVGIVFMSMDARDRDRAGLFWALCAAFCIAGYHVCYKRALSLHAAPTALFALSLGVAVPINVALLGSSARHLVSFFGARWRVILPAGVICAASFLLLLGALSEGGAARVMTLRNTSVVFAMIFAYAVGNRPTSRHWVAAVLVTMGAMVLSLR